MTKFTHLGVALCFAGAISFGANYSGKLVDSACYDKNAQTSTDTKATNTTTANHKTKELATTCAPTAATKDFALETSRGKIYKFDTSGNTKAASEFQSGTFKPDNDGDIHATVSGTLDGSTLKVDNVSGGKHHREKVKKTG